MEFRSETQIKATGKSYNNTHARLFILCDGRIIEYKEYYNPLILLKAFGSPETLRKSFGTPPKQ